MEMFRTTVRQPQDIFDSYWRNKFGSNCPPTYSRTGSSTPELGTCLRWHSLHKQFLEVRPQCPCTGTLRRSQRRSWRSPWSPPGQAPKKQNRAVPKWGQCYLLIFVHPWIAIIHVVLIKMSQSITRGFLRTSHQRCGCQEQAANLLNMDLDNASTSVCKVFQSRDCFHRWILEAIRLTWFHCSTKSLGVESPQTMKVHICNLGTQLC